jgi:hypothetical protein
VSISTFLFRSTTDVSTLKNSDYHGFTQNSFAVNPEGCFFDFAKTDAALLHALLCLVSIHYHLNNGSDRAAGTLVFAYNQAVYHQTEAVRIVNQRLTVPESYYSDTFVCAVAILANCEVSLILGLPLLHRTDYKNRL